MKGFQVAIITLTVGIFTPVWAAENARGSSVPDLSGFYDSGTQTPEQRPAAFGDRQFLTEAEAEELSKASHVSPNGRECHQRSKSWCSSEGRGRK